MLTADGIKIPKKILGITGHWPEESNSYFPKFSGIISWIITLLFPLTMIVEIAKHLDDYEVLSEHLSVTIPPTSYMIKLILCRRERKQFLELLKRLQFDCFNDYPKDCELFVITSIKTSVVVGTSFQAVCCLVILLYSVIPIFTVDKIPVRFSYDIGPLKQFLYPFQVLGLINAALNNSCIDVLAVDLMSIATAQVNILNRKISTFTKHKTSKQDQERYLKECVEHHNEIIRYIENFERVFSVIFLVQYISSGMVICNIGFQLVHTSPLSLRFANMIFYFMAMMCELGMYSWFGNEILVKSAAIKDACYESDWINCELEVRKTLIIIMEKSKKPLFLTAGKFTALSLASFATVVKTSYSYFALMQSLYRKTQN